MRIRAALLAALLTAGPLAVVASDDYVAIPAGTITSVLSGGNNQNGPVSVSAFALRSTPVTVDQFLAFTRKNPQWQRGKAPPVFVDASYLHQYEKPQFSMTMGVQPVTSVSWFAAQAYCESEGARLPTWYEWEYVAAADASHADARQDAAWRAHILSWYAKPSSAGLSPVGSSLNFYGVKDMHGLIWEWVDDFNALLVSADSRNQGDPEQLQYCGAGAISLQDRENFAILMRVALLSSLGGADATNNLGFRCARTPVKESP